MAAERKPYGPLMHAVLRQGLFRLVRPGDARQLGLSDTMEMRMTDPQPQYDGVEPTPANGMAIGSLILGILSIVTSIIPFIGIIAWVLAPIGLVLGFLARKKPGGQGLAIAGIATSIIGLIICVAWVIGLGAMVAAGSAT